MMGREVMDVLKQNIGKKVEIDYACYGCSRRGIDTLLAVDDFLSITIGVADHNFEMPFVGYGWAVRKIIGENRETLYDNPLIPPDYNLSENEEIEGMIRLTFGEGIAVAFRQNRQEAAKRKWIERKMRLEELVEREIIGFIAEGKKFVKPELAGEWENFVTGNIRSSYFTNIVLASLEMMKALSEGKPFRATEEIIYGTGIGGFQLVCLIQAVIYFHPRGNEFRQYRGLVN